MRKTLTIMVVLGILAVTMACGGETSSGDKTKTAEAGKPTAVPTAAAGTQPAGTAIKVAAKDFAFSLDKRSAARGDITFTVANTGPTAHEFVVFKTDLAPDTLPLVADKSKVDEEGEGLTHIDEIGDLNNGETKTLTVKLDAGKYVFICNLPAHYAQGMYVAFTVQ